MGVATLVAIQHGEGQGNTSEDADDPSRPQHPDPQSPRVTI